MQCPSCGGDNRSDARFCRGCGHSFAALCPACGAALADDARFCDRCGHRTAAASPPPSAPSRSAAFVPPAREAAPSAVAAGRYRIDRLLGEGGKKRVYLAHDAKLDRAVAVAVIKTDGLDEAGLLRVRREAQAMARLGSHPNIVTVHDIGEEHGQPFIVQELMEGGSLADLLHGPSNHRLDVPTALRLAQEVAAALTFAHQHAIIHRDVKPGNVWLTRDQRAKLGDFGLAMALEQSRLTQVGVMVGTVAYMPPEQALGGTITARSDLYSLGALLYEVLTGRPPFPGDDTVSVISQHLNTPPLPPSLLNAEVPSTLDTLVLALLAKSPDERPASAHDVEVAIAAIAATPAASVSTGAAPPTPPRDTAVRSPFVARERELSQLKDRMEDAIAGRGYLMMVVGEPGIGKTRISEELAVYARLRGAQVLLGQCYESEGAPPYIPFVEALRQYVGGRAPEALRAELGDAASHLAKLVSEIRTRIPDLPAAPPQEPETERYRLLEAVTAFLINASQATPLLLILDDIHWADKPSLLLLQHLARRLAGSRLLVVGTYRDVDLDRRHPLAEVLGQLRRERLHERILLRGLDADGVQALLTARSRLTAGGSEEVPRPFALALYEQTEGNPFFIEETTMHLADIGAIHREGNHWVGDLAKFTENIPEGVREVIGRRLSRLNETTNQALTHASVLGREFDFDVLQALAEMDDDALLTCLEDALGARLIGERRGGSGPAYRFTHALVQETLYGELSLARKQRLHLRAGRALEQVRAGRIEPIVGQLAHHFYDGGDAAKAIAYSRQAGDAAVRVYAWEEAVRHWEHALEFMEESGADERQRAQLLEQLGDVTYVTGIDFDKGIALLERALPIYERLGMRGKLAAVHSRLGRGMVTFGNRLEIERGRAHLEAARTILERDAPDNPILAYLYIGLATAQLWGMNREQVRTHTQQALEIGQRLQSRPVTAMALPFMGWSDAAHGQFNGAFALFDQAQQLAEAENLTFVAFLTALFRSSFDLYSRHDPRAAITRLRDELEKPRFAAAPILRWLLLGTLGSAYVAAGDIDAARAIRDGGNDFYPLLEDLRAATGDWPADEDAQRRVAAAHAQTGNRQGGWGIFMRGAELAFVRGSFERAEADLRTCLEMEDRGGVIALGGLRTRTLLARLLARTGRAADAEHEVDRCERLLAQGEDWGGTGARVRLARAGIHVARQEWDRATSAFDDALALARRYGLPWDEAAALHERARMHLARDTAGDRTAALRLLDEASAIYQRLGAKKHLEFAVADKVRGQGLDSVDFQTSIDAVASAVRDEQPDLRSHAAPDGTVTLMFSDMEGFTAMTERLGDLAARTVIGHHNRIVRQQLAAHGGFEVELQGDGFLLAFPSARRALLCAIAIQRDMAAHSATHRDEPIRVRIGLHTGEALREADKFFGKTVILAARIAAQAQGGEILVSSLVKELTQSAGDLPFGAAREAALKGLSGTYSLHPVGWQDA